MPGFDIATSHSHTSRMKDARGWFGSAGASGLAGWESGWWTCRRSPT